MSEEKNSGSNGRSEEHPLSVPGPHSFGVPSGYSPAGDQSSGQGATVSFVLHVLRRWWKVAVPAGIVLASAAAALIWLTFEPVYDAAAWLRIYSLAPRILDRPQQDSQQYVQTQVELIRSPLVLGPVISRPEIASLPEVEREEAPLEWLADEIKVKSVGQSELFQVSFAGPNAANSAKVVNAVVDSYFELRGQQDAEQTQQVIELLRQQLERQTREAERLRENYRELTKQATGKDPFPGGTEKEAVSTPHPLQQLQGQITTAQVEHTILEARIKALDDSIAGQQLTVPDAEVNRTVAQHPEVQALRAEISRKEARLGEYKARLADGDKDPLYQSLLKGIESDKARLDNVTEQLKLPVKAQIEAALANAEKSELHDMQRRLHDYEVMEKLLQEKYEQEVKNAIAYTGETLDVELARGAYDRAEDVVQRMDERIMMLQIEQSAPARVLLMQRAETPRKPQELIPWKMLLLGALSGLGLPFGLAVLWERFARRVGDARQLREQSQLPVLGEIARLPVRTSAWSSSASKRVGLDLRIFEESVDSLRTCLALSESLRDLRVFAVASAANNEGKTSVAVQLAVSTARASGEIALLIDGDMRSPDVHKVLETRIGPGLAEVLRGECSLEEAIITDWSKRVHILPAGKLRGSPHKLVGNGALRSVLDVVRKNYRYVIIDTPPILAAGEALVFARHADASLICAMRDISRMEQVNMAHERLAAAEGKPVGVVLNGVPAKMYAYRYGSYEYFRSGE